VRVRFETDPFELAVIAAIAVYLCILLGRSLLKPRHALGLSIGGNMAKTFTLKGGVVYLIAMTPLLNGNPDSGAVVNSSSASGDPRVKQVTSPTVVSDGTTAPAGSWVLDLTVSTDKETINVDATINAKWSDGFTGDAKETGVVTVADIPSNEHTLGLQIGPQTGP
jgi:hypothetical protein